MYVAAAASFSSVISFGYYEWFLHEFYLFFGRLVLNSVLLSYSYLKKEIEREGGREKERRNHRMESRLNIIVS